MCDENWELLDELRAAVLAKSAGPEDAIAACVAIIGEEMLKLSGDLAQHLATAKRLLDSAVELKIELEKAEDSSDQ